MAVPFIHEAEVRQDPWLDCSPACSGEHQVVLHRGTEFWGQFIYFYTKLDKLSPEHARSGIEANGLHVSEVYA